jgi:branched-chain amino acid transport system ATP-binding protein
MIAGRLPVIDRKLLMLAGAIATRPKLLLMDEPVGGLNAGEIDHMMDAVRAVAAQGVTIILIEHVMRFLVALSDRRDDPAPWREASMKARPRAGADRTVVDVYLGEGASQRLAALLEGGLA